jgi:hypothetical protein
MAWNRSQRGRDFSLRLQPIWVPYELLSLVYLVCLQFLCGECAVCAQAPFLGIKTPIVLAPMGGASGGALASEVSLAGGFGFLAPGPGEA